MEMTTRNYTTIFETRNEDGMKGFITGKPIVFNSRTNIGNMFNEIILPDALRKTDLTDICLMTNHDLNQFPLARYKEGNPNNTLKYSIGEDGMTIETILDIEHNPRAAELYSVLTRGDVTGMSFMFGIDEDSWEGLDTDMPTRYIKSISKIVECSVVTHPAYASTSVNARSEDIEEAQKLLNEAKKVLIQDENIAKRNKEELELLRMRNKNNFLF